MYRNLTEKGLLNFYLVSLSFGTKYAFMGVNKQNESVCNGQAKSALSNLLVRWQREMVL